MKEYLFHISINIVINNGDFVSYHVVIFSYNRGPYLKNCIDSVIKHCKDIPFTIYDDGSDDPELTNYLKSLGSTVKHRRNNDFSRHGGFYANMQAALDELDAEILILLQDDTQIVRDLSEFDFNTWKKYFLNYHDCAFLNPVFMKGLRRRDFLRYYQPNHRDRVYRWVEDFLNPSEDGPVPSFYMDICVVNAKKLRGLDWKYQPSEYLNGLQAQKILNHGMPQLPDPFIFYVPEEPVYRSRLITKGTQLAQKLSGNSVKSFVSMTPEEVELMKNRDLSIYPFAEDFISTKDSTVKKPYRFNIYRVHWLARLLNKIELLWSR
jgi:glycosyltransferase involved in cell wall biosynthesis